MTDELNSLLAEALSRHNGGDLESARRLYERVLAEEPGNADALHLLGMLHHQEGESGKAEALIRRAIDANGHEGSFHNSLGSVLKDRGETAEAEACFHKALSLAPDSADAYHNLGVLLVRTGRLEEAERHFRAAAAADPRHAEAHGNLGALLREVGKREEAEVELLAALELRPNYAEAHNNLAVLYHRQDRFEDAMSHYLRAHELKPESADTLRNLAVLHKDLGFSEDALAYYRNLLELAPGFDEAHRALLSLLVSLPDQSPEALFAEHRAYADRFPPPAESPALVNKPKPERPLRIGYLSSDFRTHPVARNMEPLFHHRDQTKFKIYCYAEVNAPDTVTNRLRSLAHAWRSTVGLGDGEVAAQIRRDKIDILVFLGAHFDANRPSIAVHRAAPVQISFHDVATSGFEEMDYLIADPVLAPRGTSEKFTERVLRLPSFYLHEPLTTSPPLSPPPCLENGFITFGSFNNPAKVGEATLALWGRTMKAVPTSRLLLKYKDTYASPMLRERILRGLSAQGIDAARVIFEAGWDGQLGHLERLNRVDIALDTAPFSGSTTTFEALWMGLPVVTLEGETMVSRWSASMLKTLKLQGFVTRNAADYAATAAELASDGERLAELRAVLRPYLVASPLCNGRLRTKQVERLYRAVWRKWVACRP